MERNPWKPPWSMTRVTSEIVPVSEISRAAGKSLSHRPPTPPRPNRPETRRSTGTGPSWFAADEVAPSVIGDAVGRKTRFFRIMHSTSRSTAHEVTITLAMGGARNMCKQPARLLFPQSRGPIRDDPAQQWQDQPVEWDVTEANGPQDGVHDGREPQRAIVECHGSSSLAVALAPGLGLALIRRVNPKRSAVYTQSGHLPLRCVFPVPSLEQPRPAGTLGSRNDSTSEQHP